MGTKTGALGIMVSRNAQRKSVLRKLRHYNTTKLPLFCFTPDGIDWGRRRIKGIQMKNGKWTEGTFPFPRAVYNRCYTADGLLADRMEQAMGKPGCFNRINQLNKWEVHQNMSKWLDAHLPETELYRYDTLVEMLDRHRLLFLKPCFGNQGKGVFRVEKREEDDILISAHHILPSLIIRETGRLREEVEGLIGSAPYLIQKGIVTGRLNNRCFDIRVLAQKNRTGQWSVTNAISRIAYEGCFNTSICEQVLLARQALEQSNPSHSVDAQLETLYSISLRTAEIIELDSGNHLGELSVDTVVDPAGHLWIIEVNGKPQKSLYDDVKVNKKSIYAKPLEYAKYLHDLR